MSIHKYIPRYCRTTIGLSGLWCHFTIGDSVDCVWIGYTGARKWAPQNSFWYSIHWNPWLQEFFAHYLKACAYIRTSSCLRKSSQHWFRRCQWSAFLNGLIDFIFWTLCLLVWTAKRLIVDDGERFTVKYIPIVGQLPKILTVFTPPNHCHTNQWKKFYEQTLTGMLQWYPYHHQQNKIVRI